MVTAKLDSVDCLRSYGSIASSQNVRSNDYAKKCESKMWTAAGLITEAEGLVNHDIRTVLLLDTTGLLLGRLSAVGRAGLSLIHLHVIVSTLAFLTLLLVIITLRILNVNLLTAGFRLGVLVVGRAGSVLGASHRGVFAFDSSTLSLLLLLFFLFYAILIAVCGKVGFRLLRRKLGWRRLVRVPILVRCARC